MTWQKICLSKNDKNILDQALSWVMKFVVLVPVFFIDIYDALFPS